MARTLDEWIKRYNRKVPEGFKRDERFALFYLPEKGFCELAATEKMIIVWQVCGDGKYWKKFAEDKARQLGLKVCGTYFVRKETEAYQKLFGFKITKVEEQDGFKRYHCIGENGSWGLMTECVFENGNHSYYVTWEVK